MKLLNKIRSFIAIDFEPLKERAFLEISEINGVLGADKSAYIPEDARSSNPHTIYDGHGRLVVGRVDAKDYFQGDDQFVGNVMSSIWFFIFTLVMSFVTIMSDGTTFSPSSILNVGLPLATFFIAILYLHKKTTQSLIMFMVWCFLELQLLSVAGMSGGSKGLLLNCLALSLPGIRLIFNNYLSRKSRAHAIYQNSRGNTHGLSAYAGLDLNYLKSLAKDKTPSYPLATADGVFEHAGLIGAVGQGQNIALSQLDGNRHMFIGGASGTGKSRSLKEHLILRNKINTKFKKENPDFKESGMIVFCGKGDLPNDLGLIEDGGILHANITPLHYKVVNGVYKEVGVKRFPLLKGLTPEKYTMTVVNANRTKGGGGDNKIFEVTGESLTYRTAVTLYYLKKYGVKALSRQFKFSVKSNYQMLAEIVKRQEIRTSNGSISFESNNPVLQDLIALVAYLKNEVTNLQANPQAQNEHLITQMKSEIEILEATIQFVKNSLNEDIQKFIQSVVQQAQSWIVCFINNSKLLDWADTDSDEDDEFDILDVMRLRHTVNADGSITVEKGAEIKRYGITMKKEEFKDAAKLTQNFIMERLFGAGAERGNGDNWRNDPINHPFDLIIDEAQNVASQSLLEYTQEFRAWGVSLIFMTQNLSALIARFDEKSILGFLSSIANHVLFDPNDTYTLEYYRQRLGKIRNFISSGDSATPIDYRHTVKRVLQLPEFDRSNPYHDEFRRFRGGYNFGYKAKNGNIQKFMGYAVPIFFNFNAFQLFSTPETIAVSRYKIDEKEPVKDLFSQLTFNELKTRGKALVLVDRGGKIRTDISTFYKLGDA